MELRFRIRGLEVAVTLQGSAETASVSVDGRCLEIDDFAIDERYVTLRTGGAEYRLPYACAGRHIHVGHGGESYEFAPAGDDERGSEASQGGFVAEITSPMPGKVIEVLVSVGAVVEADQALLVLEAMKMEQTVRAPASARIAEIRVDVAAMVGPGQTLLVLERVGD